MDVTTYVTSVTPTAVVSTSGVVVKEYEYHSYRGIPMNQLRSYMCYVLFSFNLNKHIIIATKIVLLLTKQKLNITELR